MVHIDFRKKLSKIFVIKLGYSDKFISNLIDSFFSRKSVEKINMKLTWLTWYMNSWPNRLNTLLIFKK